MIPDLVLLGCGGFGREVLEIVAAINEQKPRWNIVGILDDAPRSEDLALVHLRGLDHLGGADALESLPSSTWAVLGMGSARARRTLHTRHRTRRWATLVHPDATVGSDVSLQQGTVIAAGARLSTHIVAGAHVQVDQNVTVGHDTVLHDFCRLNPQACISGNVIVASGALIGAAATVLQGLRVGENSTVGAGAVVVRDITDCTTVKGVPAR